MLMGLLAASLSGISKTFVCLPLPLIPSKDVTQTAIFSKHFPLHHSTMEIHENFSITHTHKHMQALFEAAHVYGMCSAGGMGEGKRRKNGNHMPHKTIDCESQIKRIKIGYLMHVCECVSPPMVKRSVLCRNYTIIKQMLSK
jgi:hypothetical protein